MIQALMIRGSVLEKVDEHYLVRSAQVPDDRGARLKPSALPRARQSATLATALRSRLQPRVG
jgi:hypothetical protein